MTIDPLAITASSISTLTDTFSGTTLDTTKWTKGPGTITVSGGTLNELATTSYASIYTPAQYRLTGSSIIAQLTPLALGNGTNQMGMSLTVDAGGSNAHGGVTMIIGNSPVNAIASYNDTGGVQHDMAQVASTNPTWIRIRESAGTTYWDTSPDGTTWTNLYSMASPVATDFLYVSLWCGHYGAETDTTAHFDNVNPPIAALPGAAAATGAMTAPTDSVNAFVPAA